jgi:hypothetical protein
MAKKPIPSGIAVDGTAISREHGCHQRGEIE